MAAGGDAVRMAEGLGFTVEHAIPPPSPVHLVCRDPDGRPCYMVVAVRRGDSPYVMRPGRLSRLRELQLSNPGSRVLIMLIRDGVPRVLPLDDVIRGSREARELGVYVSGAPRLSRVRTRAPPHARTTLCISCGVEDKLRFNALKIKYRMSSEELLRRALSILEGELGSRPRFVRSRPRAGQLNLIALGWDCWTCGDITCGDGAIWADGADATREVGCATPIPLLARPCLTLERTT